MKRFDRRQGTKKKAPVLPTQRETLTLTGFGHDGRAVGRVNGIPWFVAGAVVGETVEAVSLRIFASRVDARATKVIDPSADRITPVCEKVQQCGGCSQQFLRVSQQRSQKAHILQRELGRQCDVARVAWAEPLVGVAESYRARARMAIRQGKLGFTGEGSHQHVAITHCPVMQKGLNQFLETVPELPLARAEIELLLDSDGQVGAHIVNAQKMTQTQMTTLSERMSPLVSGLWITGPDGVRHCLKSGVLTQRLTLSSTTLVSQLYPWQFSQVNPEINQRMVAQAIDWLEIQSEMRILDLFSGSGNFSVPMAVAGATVVAVESVESAVSQGRVNAQTNGCTSVTFVKQDLFVADWNHHWGKHAFDAILLDPPRAGADQVCKDLGKFDVKRVLYVSCNPATLARDAGTLAQHGYRIVRSGLMDMFPHTGHIESMTLFQKGKK